MIGQIGALAMPGRLLLSFGSLRLGSLRLGSLRLVSAILVTLAALVAGTPLSAQGCVSDSQCGAGASSANACLGDTLVMRRRSCQGGRCVEQEAGRMKCGPGSRCDALAGTCTSGGVPPPSGRGATIPGGGLRASGCIPSCTCRGNTLVIGTGTLGPGGRCFQSVQRCQKGCSCSPEPRCGEDVRPRPRAAASQFEEERRAAMHSPAAIAAAAAARTSREEAGRLPARSAEPFEAAPRRIAGTRRIVKKKRARRMVTGR